MTSSDILITIRDLAKHYEMGSIVVKALDGVDLDIARGEYAAIMGPSGSGKSTLMNLLGCLDSPTRGSYVLDGLEVAHLTDDELSDIRNRKIGFVFQTFNLLPRMSALANVELPLIYSRIPRQERHERASKTLERVGLGPRMHHQPNELSGGERQRVAIARALVTNPSLLLADEPTGNLATVQSDEIMKLFGELHDEGNTILLVTHEENIAKNAKRIIRLRDGKVVS